ncbi:hypothetical protein BC943DRAFT_8613 [Umbelopsis sp. AD052]|nr:hypothetical protein BC943DRAFT_8613 [Umbelopsis sp. AD052]
MSYFILTFIVQIHDQTICARILSAKRTIISVTEQLLFFFLPLYGGAFFPFITTLLIAESSNTFYQVRFPRFGDIFRIFAKTSKATIGKVVSVEGPKEGARFDTTHIPVRYQVNVHFDISTFHVSISDAKFFPPALTD